MFNFVRFSNHHRRMHFLSSVISSSTWVASWSGRSWPAEARRGNRWKIKKTQENSRKPMDFGARPRNFEAFREYSKDSGSKFFQNPPSRPPGTRPELEPSAGRRPAGEGRPEERKIRSPRSKKRKKGPPTPITAGGLFHIPKIDIKYH